MKIGLMEIKQALNDGRFRDVLPVELREDLAKYLHCPSCPSHVEFYRKVLKYASKQLQEYYPGAELHDQDIEDKKLAENSWTVFSCHIDQLETELRKRAAMGRVQIAVARFEEQVTVVMNQLNIF
jgi:hypothetical protein